jgi:prolyl-tRNA synthetase
MIVSCLSCNFQTGASEKWGDGNICPHCKKGQLTTQVAIELGHIFQLGTKYSEAQGALYLDRNGKQKPIIMGCYGIGVSRVIAAIIEKHNDEKGIVWPHGVAPFDVEILPIQGGQTDQEILDLTERYCAEFTQNGLEALIDDREESAGRKFNDADLIGIPIRITIGKRNLAGGKVEIKIRKTDEVLVIEKGLVMKKIRELLGPVCALN